MQQVREVDVVHNGQHSDHMLPTATLRLGKKFVAIFGLQSRAAGQQHGKQLRGKKRATLRMVETHWHSGQGKLECGWGEQPLPCGPTLPARGCLKTGRCRHCGGTCYRVEHRRSGAMRKTATGISHGLEIARKKKTEADK